MTASATHAARLFDPRRALWAMTASGVHFHPFDARTDMVRIDDVAHALSHLCRFNGHCSRMWSVASHSMLVARIVAEHLDHPELEYTALLHDAPEAFLGDVISPVQRGLPDFKDAYAKVERVVFDALGVELTPRGLLPEPVKVADAMALAIEARDLMPPQTWREWNLPFEPLKAFSVDPEMHPTEVRSRFWSALSEANGRMRGARP